MNYCKISFSSCCSSPSFFRDKLGQLSTEMEKKSVMVKDISNADHLPN